MTFSTTQFPTKGQMLKHIDTLLWKVNSDAPQNIAKELSFGGVCDRYIKDERLREIGRLKSGQQNTFGNLKVSTAKGYLQIIENWLRPAFGALPVSKVTPALADEWFKKQQCGDVTKGHIKALLFRLFEKGMLWSVIPVQRNPMELVEIKGSSRRGKRPQCLTPEQCSALLSILREPYRTMVLVALCLGLRVSELLSLRWSDFDFGNLKVSVVRSVVRGIVDRTKTEASEDDLPLDPAFAAALLAYREIGAPSSDDWLFPSPRTGRPYEPGTIQQKVLRPAGDKLGIANLGWHNFRHSYRTMLDATGAATGAQQRLMRHSQVSTTMDKYGSALMREKRQANSAAVKLTFVDLEAASKNVAIPLKAAPVVAL
jgi:integrase